MPFIRRKRPLKFRDALKAAREIGLETLEEMDPREAAAAIAAMALKTKGVDLDDPAIDWDGLLDFIERLIPLILKIIDLFG